MCWQQRLCEPVCIVAVTGFGMSPALWTQRPSTGKGPHKPPASYFCPQTSQRRTTDQAVLEYRPCSTPNRVVRPHQPRREPESHMGDGFDRAAMDQVLLLPSRRLGLQDRLAHITTRK